MRAIDKRALEGEPFHVLDASLLQVSLQRHITDGSQYMQALV